MDFKDVSRDFRILLEMWGTECKLQTYVVGVQEKYVFLENCKYKFKKILLLNFCIAASLLIASKWKSEVVPNKEEWLARMRYLALMAKLTAVVQYTQGHLMALDQFKKQWACFSQHYCNTKLDYLNLNMILELS